MKVGGGDSRHGPAGGIHWHMNLANKVEYIAGDDRRQEIPWVRVTETNGVVTEYRTAKFTDDEHMKKCAQECKKCAAACREMVKHEGHDHSHE